MKLLHRSLVLVGLCLLPAVIIQAAHEWEGRRQLAQDLNGLALREAEGAAEHLGRLFETVRQLLVTLSYVPSVRNAEREACNALFRTVVAEDLDYLNVATADAEGRILCSAVPPAPGITARGRPYFRALETKAFTLGEYTVGQTIPIPIIQLAYPMLDESGQATGVIWVAMRLDRIQAFLERRPLPPNTSLTVVDRTSTVLARTPDGTTWRGQRLPEDFSSFLGNAAPGIIEATGLDGVWRIFGYVPFGSGPGVAVAVGIDRAAAFSAINQASLRGAALIGTGIVLAVVVAVLGSRRVLLRPIGRLAAAAQSWQSGELDVRTGLERHSSELGEVARVLDGMAERLKERDAERAVTLAELARSEQRFRSVFESRVTGFTIFDARTGDTLAINDLFLEMTGHSRTDFEAGRWDWREFTPAEFHPLDAHAVAQARERGWWEPFEKRYRCTDGQLIWVRLSSAPLPGEPGRVVVAIEDVSERRAAEEALQRLNETLEARAVAIARERARIFELSQDLLAIASFDGRLKVINPAWHRLLGHDDPTLLERSLHDLIHPDDRQATATVLASLRAGQAVERFENRLCRSDGQHRWISWTAVAEGELFYAVGRDVTQQKLNLEEIAAANRQLQGQIEERTRVEATLRQMQRLEAVGQLTAGVAHDFNNLLTVVLGNLGFIERQLAARDPRVAERLAHIRSAGERGAKLTAQLLAFSRRQRLDPKPLDLAETVAAMLDLLDSTLAGTVRLETIIQPELWLANVDPTQVELVILNLAINARDAMPVGGSITLELGNQTRLESPRRPEEPDPGDYVVLTVTDTGSGMTPDVLARAFEPFFTTKEVGKGSGLGLAQVYGFAKQSGGGVAIDSRPGEGTRVRVYLPRATAAAPAPDMRAVASAHRPQAGESVLVVDDDRAVREVTSAILREHGYIVCEAGSGGLALDLLEANPGLGLAVLDYAMPGMNGSEIARQIRLRRPGLPILFLTGYADGNGLPEFEGEQLVLKPFADAELLDAVASLLRSAPNNVVALRL